MVLEPGQGSGQDGVLGGDGGREFRVTLKGIGKMGPDYERVQYEEIRA